MCISQPPLASLCHWWCLTFSNRPSGIFITNTTLNKRRIILKSEEDTVCGLKPRQSFQLLGLAYIWLEINGRWNGNADCPEQSTQLPWAITQAFAGAGYALVSLLQNLALDLWLPGFWPGLTKEARSYWRKMATLLCFRISVNRHGWWKQHRKSSDHVWGAPWQDRGCWHKSCVYTPVLPIDNCLI